MGIKIFTGNESDESNARNGIDDIVGSFRAGAKDSAGLPMSLDTWRVTTGDPEVADALKELLGGGKTSKRETDGEEKIAVDLKVDKVKIRLEPNIGLRVRFVQRDSGFKIQYTSDGETITYADGTTEPDPDVDKPLKDRMALAEKGRGPKIEVDLLFRLDEDPELGRFRFQAIHTKSFIWGLVFDKTEAAYEAHDDGVSGVLATLGKQKETIKNGPNAGREFTKTVLKILGPVE